MGKKLFFCGAGFLIVFGIFLIIAGLVIQLAVFPAIVKHMDAVIGLKDDGKTPNDFTNDWLYSNYTIKMQYYLWNYTNGIEIVDRGMAPDAYQVGPYSYSQIDWYDWSPSSFTNDSNYFHYLKKSTYYFDASTSCEKCNPDHDYVRIPDPVFFSFLDLFVPILEGFDPDVAGLLSALTIPFFGAKIEPIITVKVSDILFNGYKSPIVKTLEQFNGTFSGPIGLLLSLAIAQLESAATAINAHNGTTVGTYSYTVNTGKSDYKDLAKIVSMGFAGNDTTINSMPEVWWNGYDNNTCKDPTYARKFRGTNTDLFAPFVSKTDVLEGYVDDICRSVNFKYSEETTVKGINAYRFTLDVETSFNYDRPENCGYCFKQNHPLYGRSLNTSCLPTGLLDLFGCRGGGTTHLIVSMPQFLSSETSVLRWFPRMKPDPEDHQTTIDIEPTTGAILRANKRLQVNVAGGSYSGTVFRQVANGAYPIAWLNNSYLADDKIVHDLKHDLINPRHTVMLVCYIAGVGFGALLALIGLFSLILRKVYRNNKSPSILANDISSQPHEYHPQYIYKGDTNGKVTRRRPMQNSSHDDWTT